VLASALLLAGSAAADGPGDSARAEDLLARQPLHFEPNHGQTDPAVRYLARSRGYTLFLTLDEARLALWAGEHAHDVVGLRFLGASSGATVEPRSPLPSRSHYLLGRDPAAWRTDVPHFAQVTYRDLYPGVSLTYYGTGDRELEYDLVLEPGTDVSTIRLGVTGVVSLRLDQAGDLLLETEHGVLVQKAPVVFQRVDGERRSLPSRYLLRGPHEVGFAVEGAQSGVPIVIDPVLSWSTYLGGTNVDAVKGVAVDSTGVYVTGQAFSPNFPVAGTPFQAARAGANDAFVAKFDLGGAVVYSTYLGGTLDDFGNGIAVEGMNAYVVGSTVSTNFPVTAGTAYQPAKAGGASDDAFFVILNPAGAAMLYGTYLGGTQLDRAYDVAVDSNRQPVVVGETASNLNFPRSFAFQTTYGGGASDAFVTKFNATGGVVYSTFLGGTGSDHGDGVALTTGGSVMPIVTGRTTSTTGFPIVAAVQPANGGGLHDAFVTQFNVAGSALVFSTYLGGGGNDEAHAIAYLAGASGGVFLAGQTTSANFPLVNPFQSALSGPSDAFVTKLSPTGASITYSTYLGGSNNESGLGIAADTSGHAYVTGYTQSADFPRSDSSSLQGGGDAFVARLVPTGCAPLYARYIGGTGPSEVGNGIAVSPVGSAFVGGQAQAGFPVTGGAFQTTFGGATDGFVLRLDDGPTATDVELTKGASLPSVLTGATLTYTLTVRNTGTDGTYDVVVTDVLPAEVTFVSSSPPCSLLGVTLTCNLGCLGAGATSVVSIDVTVNGDAPALLTNDASVTHALTELDPSDNMDSVDVAVTQNADLVISKGDSPDPVLLGGILTYNLTVRNDGPSTASPVTLTDPLPPGTTFVSASGGCNESGGTVTCDLGTLAPAGIAGATIQVRVEATGTVTNTATVSSAVFDSDLGDNQATSMTRVDVPSAALPVFAATSTGGPGPLSGRNLLQWVSPGLSFSGILIRFNKAPSGTSNCAFPTDPLGSSDGSLTPPGPFGPKGSEPHPGLELDTAYCYTAWVEIVPGTFSVGRTVRARPFNSVPGPVKWAYATGGASVAAPGISPTGVVAVSNDRVLHALLRDGASGGEWLSSFLPPIFGGPAQGRPPVVPTGIVVGSSRLAFVGTQDGLVHAVDADTGTVRWSTVPALGGMVQAAPAGMFGAFGAGFNLVFVGTRDAGADNKFYALDAATGGRVGPAFDNGGGANGIGIISAGAAMDYAGSRVFFASKRKVGGSANTLWCLGATAAGVSPAPLWALALGDILTGPVLRNGRVYVANTANEVWSVAADGSSSYKYVLPPGENVKGFVSADRLSIVEGDVYFATESLIWGFSDMGSLAPKFAPVALPGGATPSTLLLVSATKRLYVGASNGKLYEVDASVATPTLKSVVLGNGAAAGGTPSLSASATPNLVFVGSDAGVIYAVEAPLP
jgi:uncharacterized repeat protein (TIGR01451 family)